MAGTIVFVHGTGVRLQSYKQSFTNAKKCAAEAGIREQFVECAWGDPLGVVYEQLQSLPDPPDRAKLQDQLEEDALWQWRFNDPLLELAQLGIPGRAGTGGGAIPPPGQQPEWERLWDRIAAYQPSMELGLLLKRGGLEEIWGEAWREVVERPAIARKAFEESGKANELADASQALARALVAQVHVTAVSRGLPGPSSHLRESLASRLIEDWGQRVRGLGTFLWDLAKRPVTRWARRHREQFSDAAALPIGDILLYQARGEDVRKFIRSKISAAAPPVTVIAHSLGGIACVDLLALPNPPKVERLITAGSQAPLLYELGALASLKPPSGLPDAFPRWLNIYDRNDFLSYYASRLFPKARDWEARSGQAFPDSHSAYFANDEVWGEVQRFMAE